MSDEDDYEGPLFELFKMLQRGQFMTTLQIAYEMKCPKVTAYRRLKALKKRGCEFQTRLVREGVSGPKSVAYAL